MLATWLSMAQNASLLGLAEQQQQQLLLQLARVAMHTYRHTHTVDSTTTQALPAQ